jgi:hypothetical protein
MRDRFAGRRRHTERQAREFWSTGYPGVVGSVGRLAWLGRDYPPEAIAAAFDPAEDDWPTEFLGQIQEVVVYLCGLERALAQRIGRGPGEPS